MKFLKNLLVFLIATVFIISMLSGCGSSKVEQADESSKQEEPTKKTEEVKSEKKEAVTLTYLCANENFPDSFKDFVDNYEKATGNKVDVQLFPAPEYDKMIRTKMMSGQNFDLYRTDSIKMAEVYWPKDWPEDFSNRPWVSRLSQGGRTAIAWSDGRITGLPVTNNGGFGIMYNKDIFAKAGVNEIPKTWSEFLEVCEKIKKAGVISLNIQLANGSEFGTTHLMHQLYANVWLTRKDSINDFWEKIEKNQLNFSEIPEFEKALGQIVELKDKGYINADFISTTFEMSQDKFGKGEVAMHPCGDFILQPMLSKYPDVKVGFFPCPYGDTEGVIATYCGIGLSVSSKAKFKEEALEFVDFFASKEEQQKYMEKNPGVGVFSDVQSNHNMISENLEKYANNGRAFAGIFEMSQVWPEMESRKIIQELMLGAKTPKQMLEEIDKKAEIIAKGKKLEGW